MACVFESSCVKFDSDTLVDNSCSAVFSKFITSALNDAWNNQASYEMPQEPNFTHLVASETVGKSVYDLYETTYNNITFEFFVETCEGKLVKIFINAKSIAADLKRSKRVVAEAFREESEEYDGKNKSRAISASNVELEVAWKAFGFDDSERFICACRYKQSKSVFNITEPRFFCEIDAFCEFMCRYRGEVFRNWVRGKEFITDNGAEVYCVWGKSKIKGAKYLVKAGRTERLNERFFNIWKDYCVIDDRCHVYVQHGSAAEAAAMKVFFNGDYKQFGGTRYNKEWIKFKTEKQAKDFYEAIHDRVLYAGSEATIEPFVSKPQRTVYRDASKIHDLIFARLTVVDKVEHDGKGNKKRAFKLTPFKNSEITYDDWKSMKKAMKDALNEEETLHDSEIPELDPWQMIWNDPDKMTTGGEDL